MPRLAATSDLAGPPLEGSGTSALSSVLRSRMAIVEDTGVSVERIAWIAAVLICAGLAGLCFAIGYSGYGWTVIAIALAAAVNLLPEKASDGRGPDSLGPGQSLGQ